MSREHRNQAERTQVKFETVWTLKQIMTVIHYILSNKIEIQDLILRTINETLTEYLHSFKASPTKYSLIKRERKKEPLLWHSCLYALCTGSQQTFVFVTVSGVRNLRVASLGDSGFRSVTGLKSSCRTIDILGFNQAWRIHLHAHSHGWQASVSPGCWLDASVPCHLGLYVGLLTTWRLLAPEQVIQEITSVT